MAEKVTTMVLKVDLQCARCYKKIKKILCEFPQIGDQVYDDKQNTVTITVQSCNPEKIRDKLYCKGGKIIECIEIKKPPPTTKPNKDKDAKTEPNGKSKKGNDETTAPPAPVPIAVAVPIGVCCGACHGGCGRPPTCSCGCGTGRWCGRPPTCSCGCGTGQSCRRPPTCSCGCGTGRSCGRPPTCSCGCGTGWSAPSPFYSRCDFYFSEENPSGCAIM
ncbi:hypothetical protein F0562_027037 [Nyssa sinensis]|uniref:HMA domain-containing protein n=1 Tax=Nyssa sinensis TaxID=561372 RepID=A0A5J5B4W6_9ASTE|nr:hypothetical protein F0562_027037 [Nyssa sinensis]